MRASDKARQSPEPVFSVAEELAFQDFRAVFGTGFTNTALVSAVMLTFAFAVSGAFDQECLGYRGQVISSIREKMDCVDEATSASTIGAILLLAGVEVSAARSDSFVPKRDQLTWCRLAWEGPLRSSFT